MDLLVAATSKEIQPFLNRHCESRDYQYLVTGAGCVETTLQLSRFLLKNDHSTFTRVINIGVAGAYLDSGLDILDICLAEHEFLGDLGVCFTDTVEPLTFNGAPVNNICLDAGLINNSINTLNRHNISAKRGNFVTVNGVSGTAYRGKILRDQFEAVCENMEGFAAARVCESFALPFMEIRCVSNFVEDRNTKNWQLAEACERLGFAVSSVLSCHQ